MGLELGVMGRQKKKGRGFLPAPSYHCLRPGRTLNYKIYPQNKKTRTTRDGAKITEL